MTWLAIRGFLSLAGGKLLAWAKLLPWYVWTHLGAVLIGMWLGAQLSKPKTVAHETAAPAVRQADSSLVLPRAPDSAAAPQHLIPKGDKLEREIRVTVQPKPALIATKPVKDSAGNLYCPCTAGPVHLDLSLVRLPDLTHRVIASSPDGAVTGGIDVPVDTIVAAHREPKWAAGPLYDPGNRRWGGTIDRELGPLRVSASELPPQRGFGNEVLVGLRVRF